MNKEPKPLPPRRFIYAPIAADAGAVIAHPSVSEVEAPDYVPYVPESSLKAAVAEARASAFEEAMDMLAERLGQMEKLSAHDIAVAMNDIAEEAQASRAGKEQA